MSPFNGQIKKNSFNTGFSLFDATSLEYARRHNGQYNMIFLTKSLVEPIVTAFSGFLVVASASPYSDCTDRSCPGQHLAPDPKNYQYLFYTSDVCYGLCLMMTIFLLKIGKVDKSGPKVSMGESARAMLNPSVLNLLCTCMCFGILNGVALQYIPVHLQENLHANIGMMCFECRAIHYIIHLFYIQCRDPM